MISSREDVSSKPRCANSLAQTTNHVDEPRLIQGQRFGASCSLIDHASNSVFTDSQIAGRSVQLKFLVSIPISSINHKATLALVI